MELLKQRILAEGRCFEGGILKVDNFINHQMDPVLMEAIAEEFVRRFAGSGTNKILTIEASGIAPAIMTGYLMKLPVVFAKKKRPSTMEHMLSTTVYSFTKNRNYDVCVCGDYLHAGDNVLFIDASRDFRPGKNQNQLMPEHIERIVSTFTARQPVDKYAALVPIADILSEHDGNLNIPRYVDTFEEEEEIDLLAVRAERRKLDAELATLETQMAAYLKELGYDEEA